MTDWTAGYVADIGYTFGYYSELHPVRLKLALLSAGLAVPNVVNACELGFGQGLSANMHAAAGVARWWGTDFNPSQAGFANELAQVAGSGAQLFDQSFEEFCGRADLPDFDFIGLHGIWSWISDANRRVIVDFIRRKLRVGGVVYISYNTLPGWAAMVPMRHLLTRHADMLGASGEGIVRRIDGALDFAESLLQVNPAYARAHPQVAERIAAMKKQNRHYLAHEYFNRDWHPMHFLDMADWMSQAKLGFACSANYHDYVDAVNLTPDQQGLMKAIPDPMFREAVRDFMVNTQFRRDYWVKGGRSISTIERAEQLRAQRVVLVNSREAVTLTANTPLGEATLNAEIYGSVLDALAEHKPQSIAQLERAVQKKNVNLSQLLQSLLILIGKGDVLAVQDERVSAKAKPQCDRLNRHLMSRARGNGDISHLASPVTGGGYPVGRFEQLFLSALQQGEKTPQEIAASIWQLLKVQGQLILRENKPIESDAESLAELEQQFKNFEQRRLPILRALQIA
jgi:SAM-dependent methyltransferase